MRIRILRAQTVTLVMHSGGFVDQVTQEQLDLAGETLTAESIVRGPKQKGGRVNTVTLRTGPILGAKRYFEIAEADYEVEAKPPRQLSRMSPEWLPFMPRTREPFLPSVPGFTLLGMSEFSCPYDDTVTTCRVAVYRCEAFMQALVDAGLCGEDPEPGAWPETEFVLLPPPSHDGWFWGGTGAPMRHTMNMPGLLINPPGVVPPTPPEGDRRIEQPFLIARTPVTQAVWEQINLRANGSLFGPPFSWNPSSFKGSRQPITDISQVAIALFCQTTIARLITEPTPALRLPTRNEWEFACRGNTRVCDYYGRQQDRLGEYAWFNVNSDNHPHDVAGKRANAYGLFDMLGNVAEWGAEREHPHGEGHQPEAFGPTRGGSWDSPRNHCRLINDGITRSTIGMDSVGFRPVASITQTVAPAAGLS